MFLSLFLIFISLGFSQNIRIYSETTNYTNLTYDSRFQIASTETLSSQSFNLTYGTDSYSPYIINKPKLLLEICHENLTTNHYIDLGYFTNNYSMFESILNIPPKISEIYSRNVVINGTLTSTNCTNLSLDLASRKAIYPGSILPIIYIPNNSSKFNSEEDFLNFEKNKNYSDVYFLPELDLFFNGSYDMSVRVLPSPKRYLLSTKQIHNDQDEEILTNAPYLMTSIVAGNGTTIVEDKLSPEEGIELVGSFKGDESVMINDIISLKIKVYEPCTPLNESGYYILNRSLFNVSETCIVIENISNLVLNFVGEILSGNNLSIDNSTNTSLINSSLHHNVCAIKIKNSENITIEALRAQLFYTGICIENSTAEIFGDGSTYNVNGARVYDRSVASFYDVTFENANSEINATNNSFVRLNNVSFLTAQLNSSFVDAVVKSVTNPPPRPNTTEELYNISQFIEYDSQNNNTWAQISFIYPEPMPNNVSTNNMYIWKFHGEFKENYLVSSTFNNITNTTTNVTENRWVGNWTRLNDTIILPNYHMILSPNISSFSVFVPFGNKTIEQKPVPNPTPKPKPKPTGGGGGGGSIPSKAIDSETIAESVPIELELELPDSVTIKQGEAYSIEYNISNVGLISAYNVSVGAISMFNWETSKSIIKKIAPGENLTDMFLIAPDVKAVAKDYYVPIEVFAKNGGLILTDILKVKIVPRFNLSRLKIIEYPSVIKVAPSSVENIAFLAENLGEGKLKDIKIKLSKNVSCIKSIKGSNNIEGSDVELFDYSFYSDSKIDECDVNLLFYDDEETLVGFAPVKFIVTDDEKESVAKKLYLFFILIAWTVLSGIIIMRRLNYK